jgi:hypothetical protein
MEKNDFDAWDFSVIIETLFCFEKKVKIFLGPLEPLRFCLFETSETGYPVPHDAASYNRTNFSRQGSIKLRCLARNLEINSPHKDYEMP